jgi:pyruvate/2-oxoglutarate dehydrogenase complex dihydrolipoamide acyltransferase (E2) component
MALTAVPTGWDRHLRGEWLAGRRAELLARLPQIIPAARSLSHHRREEVLDDAITWTAYDHHGDIETDEQLEAVLWAAAADRVKRAHEGRYDTVRGPYTQTTDAPLAYLPGHGDDPADVVEQRYELEVFLAFIRGLGETERAVFYARHSRPGDRVYGYPMIARLLDLPVKEVRAAMRTFEQKLALAQIVVENRQAFTRRILAALPAPILVEHATRPAGWRETFTDWLTRPFAGDAATAASSLASSGGGRGLGTLAIAVCLGGTAAGGTYCAITGDLPLTGPRKPKATNPRTQPAPSTAPSAPAPHIARDAQLQAALAARQTRERAAAAAAARQRAAQARQARIAARRRTAQRAVTRRQAQQREIARDTQEAEQAPTSPAPATSSGNDFDFEQSGPSQPVQPAPAPATGGGEFTP